MARVLSAVDIGSNTVHLLVAETDRGSLRRVSDETEWLNLGEVVAKLGQIPLNLQDQLIATLDRFKKQAKADRAVQLYAFGTEAMRVAKNSKQVLQRVRVEAGIEVELVSGQREAELSLRGVLVDTDAADDIIVAEIGGGSGQIAYAKSGKLVDSVSLPIGTGTLISRHGLTCPCREDVVNQMTRSIQKQISGAGDARVVDGIIGSGGVARGIWRAVHPDGDRQIALPELDYLIWAAQRLTVDEICARFQVKARRAATLLPGAIAYREILMRYGQSHMLVSRFGVREGAVLEMESRKVKGCPL